MKSNNRLTLTIRNREPLVSNISSSGLTFEEEESFLMMYNAELASNRVQLCKNEIEKFQRYNEPECPEEWKPQRLDKKIKWWEQKLENAEEQDKKNANRLHRENEASIVAMGSNSQAYSQGGNLEQLNSENTLSVYWLGSRSNRNCHWVNGRYVCERY